MIKDLTQEKVRELLDYDPETGVFTWKKRCGDDHGTKIFNGKFSGKTAKNIDVQGYVVIQIKGRTYKAHRLAWLLVHGRFPPQGMDHLNRVRTDNRIANLREASVAENGKNRSMSSNNTSLFTGVRWNKKHAKWYASIRVNRKLKHLGSFESYYDAIAARMKANVELGFSPTHGERT